MSAIRPLKTEALYVHIPFCRHICGYCDFAKARYEKGLADRYLEALNEELKQVKNRQLRTLYIGGGTPTALDEEQLERLLKLLAAFDVSEEYTVEVNPETFSKGKAFLLAKYGVNRVSLGVQSFNEFYLKQLGRAHDQADIYNSLKYLDEAGIKNRSADLMYGFHDQSVDELKEDLKRVCELDITHLSIYELEVHEHTALGRSGYEKCDEETGYLMYDAIIDHLNNAGLKQYEISSFAKEGCKSKHNLAYWHYDNYYGAGLAAAGKIDDVRYENTHNFMEYLAGNWRKEEIRLSVEDLMFENIMMSLRLKEGLNIAEFNRRYDTDFLVRYAEPLKKNRQHLVLKNGFLHTDRAGMFVLNDILLDFMDD